jgi:hypothetical protein
MFRSNGARGGLIAAGVVIAAAVGGGIWLMTSRTGGDKPAPAGTPAPRAEGVAPVAPKPAAVQSTPPAMLTGDGPLGLRRSKDVTRLLAPEKPNTGASSILEGYVPPPAVENPRPDFSAPLEGSLPPGAR